MGIAIVKLLIAGVLFLITVILELLSSFSVWEILGFLAAGCLLCAFSFSKGDNKPAQKKIAVVSSEKTEYNDVYEKANADYRFLQTSLPQIQDKELHYWLDSMQQVAGRLLAYLTKHPERIPAAMRFVTYYQDRTVSLVRQYLSMREVGLRPELQQNLLVEMRNTFRGFLAAYETQLAKVTEAEMKDMEAEMKVAQEVMEQEGIQPKTADYRPIAEAETKKEEKAQDTSTPLKYAGIALVALLGAVGIYKMTDKKKED